MNAQEDLESDTQAQGVRNDGDINTQFKSLGTDSVDIRRDSPDAGEGTSRYPVRDRQMTKILQKGVPTVKCQVVFTN